MARLAAFLYAGDARVEHEKYNVIKARNVCYLGPEYCYLGPEYCYLGPECWYLELLTCYLAAKFLSTVTVSITATGSFYFSPVALTLIPIFP
jgi:hypothetical protein